MFCHSLGKHQPEARRPSEDAVLSWIDARGLQPVRDPAGGGAQVGSAMTMSPGIGRVRAVPGEHVGDALFHRHRPPPWTRRLVGHGEGIVLMAERGQFTVKLAYGRDEAAAGVMGDQVRHRGRPAGRPQVKRTVDGMETGLPQAGGSCSSDATGGCRGSPPPGILPPRPPR
jgi:hypothetical protein